MNKKCVNCSYFGRSASCPIYDLRKDFDPIRKTILGEKTRQGFCHQYNPKDNRNKRLAR